MSVPATVRTDAPCFLPPRHGALLLHPQGARQCRSNEGESPNSRSVRAHDRTRTPAGDLRAQCPRKRLPARAFPSVRCGVRGARFWPVLGPLLSVSCPVRKFAAEQLWGLQRHQEKEEAGINNSNV
jgi:hypothetical protein